jgi:hypothetical protein
MKSNSKSTQYRMIKLKKNKKNNLGQPGLGDRDNSIESK